MLKKEITTTCLIEGARPGVGNLDAWKFWMMVHACREGFGWLESWDDLCTLLHLQRPSFRPSLSLITVNT